MIALKLAYRNLKGAGLRTWLNVIVLSFAYVIIIFNQGFLDGWSRQAREDMIDWEIGGGVYWHAGYDPYDVFTIQDGHGLPPSSLKGLIADNLAEPVLVAQAAIYPQGRVQSILLKGIDPGQTILNMPTAPLAAASEEIPVLIGTRMAKRTGLQKGDFVTVRWRDANETFDAADAKVVEIMKTNDANVDVGQFWVPMDRLQAMMSAPGEATTIILSPEITAPPAAVGWEFKDHDFLLKEVRALIKTKSIGGSVMFIMLLFLAMLAIFDSQMLAIFKRRKEIGTLIALGMTRGRVVRLFTVEGAMHGILAALVAAVYGIPLLGMLAKSGWAMPEVADSMGIVIAEKIFPLFSIGLIAATTAVVMITVTVVSYIPARKIAQLNPTEAIKGKIS